jgi:hypothetical protein
MDTHINIDSDGIVISVNEHFYGNYRLIITFIGFINGLLKAIVFANSQRSVG